MSSTSRKTARAKPVAQTAQLKITLRYLDPAIWRRVLVPHDITLPRLHAVIQTIMPWTDSHLHSFFDGNEYYQPNMADFIFGGDTDSQDEAKYRLNDLSLKEGGSILYTYDFGDDWEHDIHLEKLHPAAKRLPRAEVLAGENACPPDDCGSIDGYCELVEIMLNPKHPEHADRREWLGLRKGEKFDPHHYAPAPANAALSRLKV